MRPRLLGRLSVIVALALAVVGCDGGKSKSGGDGHDGHTHGTAPTVEKTYAGNYPINVVCTTGMVADLVRNIGGDKVKVTQIMGEGVDPHLYKASPGDVNLLGGADAIFYSGLHLEGKMSDVFVRMARKKPTFAVTEYIPEDRVLDSAGGAF